MKLKLKNIRDQVIVITGASSGIGLATARLAAEKGACVVGIAREENALLELVDEMKGQGKQMIHAVADVGNEAEVRRAGERAIAEFGRIDTWVNNAGVSMYGKLTDVSVEDSKRLFETDFWGVVNGSRVAIEHIKKEGGALINIGSVLCDRAIPLQGMYSAAKHAVKAFTDSLRMEVEREKLPISISLIKPASIDTPYVEHAKNYLEVEPKATPPVYSPKIVAEAILHAAEHAVRDLYVGGGAKALAVAGAIAPRLADKMMERTMFSTQRSDYPAGDGGDALYAPADDGREYGFYEGRVREKSIYTQIAMHPLITGAVALGMLGGAIALVRSVR